MNLELLALGHPDKTGKELLELQKELKKEEERKRDEQMKIKLAECEEINKNGKFYLMIHKGSSNTPYVSLYKVIDAQFRYNCICATIIITRLEFTENINLKNLSTVIREYESVESYFFTEMKEITLQKYSEILKYFDNSVCMWKDI